MGVGVCVSVLVAVAVAAAGAVAVGVGVCPAAPTIAKTVTKCGGTLAIAAEGFEVQGTEGPLLEGELGRAVAWAQQIMARVWVTRRVVGLCV